MSLDGRGLVLSSNVLEGDLDVFLAKVHLRSEGGGGLPSARGTGRSLLKHLVDLLKSKTLGLRNEEVSEHDCFHISVLSKEMSQVNDLTGNAAKSTPHEEDVGSEPGTVRTVGNEVRSDDTNNAVPEPVGGGRKTDTARTNGEREDLANDNPCARSPGSGKNGDVQADESNHGTGGVGVGWVVDSVLASGSTNNTNDELHDDHTGGTVNQDGTTSKLLNHPEGGRSREHVDERSDETDEEGVLDGAELLEEDGAEVEDEVDTSKLLHHLNDDTKEAAADVGGTVRHAA